MFWLGQFFFLIVPVVPCFGIAVLVQCQFLFYFSHQLMSEGGEDLQEVMGRYGWSSRLQVTEGIFHIVWHHAQYIKLGEKGEVGDIWNDICIPKSPL